MTKTNNISTKPEDINSPEAILHFCDEYPSSGQNRAAAKLIRKLLSAAPLVAVTDNWQPIETAPKDGKTILLCCKNKMGNWRTFRGQWVSREYIDEYFDDTEDCHPNWMETSVNCEDDQNMWHCDPTHWMPLPAAPGVTQVAPQATVTDAQLDAIYDRAYSAWCDGGRIGSFGVAFGRALLATPPTSKADTAPVAWMTADGSDAWTDQKKRQVAEHGGQGGKQMATQYSVPLSLSACGKADTWEMLRVAISALKFYADGDHFSLSDPDAWDTVSGEPANFQCDEAGTATVEDGSLAKLALQEIAGENKAYTEMMARSDAEDATPSTIKAEPQWVCFHCEEAFDNREAAAKHFGPSERYDPACQVDIEKYREMQDTVARYCEEDTDLHRQIYALQSDIVTARQRAEEEGYARGLRDAVKYPDDVAAVSPQGGEATDLPRDDTGRVTSDYEPTPLEIKVCRGAICREFGNNGTDGYYIRILKAIKAASPVSDGLLRVADRNLCAAYQAGSDGIEFDLLAAKREIESAAPATLGEASLRDIKFDGADDPHGLGEAVAPIGYVNPDSLERMSSDHFVYSQVHVYRIPEGYYQTPIYAAPIAPALPLNTNEIASSAPNAALPVAENRNPYKLAMEMARDWPNQDDSKMFLNDIFGVVNALKDSLK